MLLSGIRPDKCDQSSVLDGSASRSTDADTVPSRDVFFPAFRINSRLMLLRLEGRTIKHLQKKRFVIR